MSFKVSGKITDISEVRTLQTGAKVLDYRIDTGDEWNNVYLFNMYKKPEYSDACDKFVQFNKVGDLVTVEFNVSTTKDKKIDDRYYTNLSHWRSDKINAMPTAESITAKDFAPDREEADFPF